MSDTVPQGLVRQSGVVLRRDANPEGNISLYLLLKGIGPVWVSAPGAGRGRVRFGGGAEPLSWGNFNLYKGTRRFYLKSVDVKEDFWSLRAAPVKLRALLEWDRLLCLHLVPGLPCDELVALFYWSSILVREGADPLAVEWRFLRKWLEAWGLAPSLVFCLSCGKPLGDAFWKAEGLDCPECARQNGGACLPDSRRKRLIAAAECPFDEVKRLFPPSENDREFWNDSCKRMKNMFEYQK
ncbi:DNA repair protein RecO [Aminivibrio sp.]|uniref:DNA repair protein RecO n=1 Tax=Aminivibrio sp. TaxID=1872489 RepID=UPI001A4355C3|nr:DNA repair protein RecO C-terminal domain-containing protein [Aminivibrio sp.]MBL3538313.1 DNA repair protein RecO C-terminal domain-containing protein [Aminivibrio sp.]